MSQIKNIKKHLEKGNSLTAMEALVLFKCMRCASRISDLKRLGMDIKTEMVTDNKKRYARYSITKQSALKF